MEGGELNFVLETGSFSCKCGRAGEDNPSVELRSMVGRSIQTGAPQHFGEDLLELLSTPEKEKSVSLKMTQADGTITSWDDAEVLWNHIFYERMKMDKDPQHGILITEAIEHPHPSYREKITQIMFETFEFKGVYLALPSLLTLLACGTTSGAVVELGHAASFMVPIYEGSPIRSAIRKTDVGGKHVTEHLIKLLNERLPGGLFDNFKGKEQARQIKERLCYVALDFEEEVSKSNENVKTYQLPDGQEITIEGRERVFPTEALFQPSLIGCDSEGLRENLYNSIMACPLEIRREFMFSNIVLSGRTALFPGIEDRVWKDIQSIGPDCRYQVRAIANKLPTESQKHATWQGGSILASLSRFQEMMISSQEYDETGPTTVHRKCW